jgi:hypothetical protein
MLGEKPCRLNSTCCYRHKDLYGSGNHEVVEQRALRLDDPIAKYLPQDLIHGINVYQGHDYSNEINIEHLLAHTSGIPDYYDEKGNDGKTLFEIFKANKIVSDVKGKFYFTFS